MSGWMARTKVKVRRDRGRGRVCEDGAEEERDWWSQRWAWLTASGDGVCVCKGGGGNGGGIWAGVEEEGRDVVGGRARGKYMYMLH